MSARTSDWKMPLALPGRAVVPRPAPPDVRLDGGGWWCPLDDTLLRLELTGWSCTACGAAWDHAGRRGWWLAGGVDLAARLDTENVLQAAGLLLPEHRSTCGSCRVWITPGHRAGHAMLASIRQALTDDRCERLDADRVVCGLPRPCPWHAVRVTAVRVDRHAEWLRRLDRRAACAVVAGAAAVFGTIAGLSARDVAGQVPEVVGLLVAGGMVTAAVVVWGLWELRHWWGGWWPYRHNRLLDERASRREGVAGRG